MGRSAYEIPHQDLVAAFGISASTLGYIAGESTEPPRTVKKFLDEEERVRYLHGALLARLDGARPPVRRGDYVRFRVPGAEPVRVSRVYYIDHHWFVSIAGDTDDDLYTADLIALVRRSPH